MRKSFVLLLATTLTVAACGTTGEDETTDTPTVTAPVTVSSEPSDPTPSGTDQQAEEPLTFLLIGLDADSGSQRADVIMLIRANGSRTHLTAMSIPRDTWVEVPGYGENKINAAYAFGEEELLVETVSGLYGTTVDHTVTVDFEAFTELSTILGPITIDTADGQVTLEGDEALRFVRERYSLPAGDFDRIRRQQAYLAGVAEALREASPTQIMDLASLAGNYIQIDGSSGARSQAILLSLATDLAGTEPIFFSAPHGGTGWSDDGQSIVLTDPEGTAELAGAYESDTVHEWVQSSGNDTLDSRPVN